LEKNGEPKTIAASDWLDHNRAVEQMTWAPGEQRLIRDRLMADGGWIERKGVACFNLYRPPTIEPGDKDDVGPWLDHARTVFGEDADHIILWLAHRVQRPQEKINHALLLGGAQGVGKDTLLEPVKRAVGPWNFIEVSPQQMLGSFTGFVKSVILRVSEIRDLGEVDRYAFYEHSKTRIVTPPDVLRVNEKHLREYYVLNCTGIILTSNHKTDGLYLPPDDRRYYVAWSDRVQEDFAPGYWNKLYAWYDGGGDRNVAAYLATIDITGFDPKAPPKKTAAFWAIADANRAPEDASLADTLDKMGTPDVTTLDQIRTWATGEFAGWISDTKNRRAIPHRLEKCGYVPVRNDGAKDGLWKVAGARKVIYARATLSIRDQIKAASGLTGAQQ
jgi:Family of unknown function (DUF5906)